MWQEVIGESDVNLLQCGDACRASRAVARREKLVAVARKLFSENGFHGTGVAQLAAVSGIKVGQIYRDFTDKEAIVAEIVESDLAAFLNDQEITDAIERRNIPAIRDWLCQFVRCDDDTESEPLIAEIMAEAARNDRIRAIAHSINRSVKTALARAVTALAPRPDQAEARDQLVDMILTMGAGLIYRRIGDPDFEEAATYRRLLAVLDRSIDELLADGPYSMLQKDDCGFVTGT